MQNSTVRLNLSDGVAEKEVILVGTAHVSAASAALVKKIIEAEAPDTVCVELDDGRYQAITQKQRYQDTDLVKIIKSGRAGFFLVNLILSNYQKRMANQFGIQSGQEMLQAIDSAKATGAQLVCADRNIQTTFKRIWKQCSFWEKCKLLGAVVMSIFDTEELTEDDLARLKESDMLTAALSELGENFSGVKTALVDERDQYLAENIRTAPGKKIVAVLGAAHLPGIQKEIYKTHDLAALNNTGKKSNVGKIFGWATVLTLAALIAVTFTADFQAGLLQTGTWLALVMAGAGIGALIGGACLPAVLTGIVCAPLGALSPVLASGWFSGIAEAHFRKPKVSDFEKMSEDLTSLTGFWKNKVTRVLLVVVFTNIGCALGNIAGGVNIITTFFNTMGF